MKKVWLMGKVRDLDMKNPKPFEDGVNDDLAKFNGKNLKGIFEVISVSSNEIIFHWKLSVPKENQPNDPDGIPLAMWWLITGECDSFQPEWDLPVNTILNLCPNAIITYNTKDLCDLYKDNSKYYKADKFRKVEIEFKPNYGLMMTLKLYRNGK